MSTETTEAIGSVAVESGADSTADRLLQQWKVIAGVAVAIVAIVAGYWLYTSMQESKNEEAAAALARVRATFDASDFEGALTGKGLPAIDGQPVMGLQAIVDQYGSTSAGKVAAVMAGTCYMQIGKVAEARTAFEAAQGSDSPVVQMGALNGLGACAETDKDFAGAADLYEKAAAAGSKSGLEARSLVYAGLAYEKAGNKEKAGETYRTVVKKFSSGDMSQPARAGLARLGMRID